MSFSPHRVAPPSTLAGGCYHNRTIPLCNLYAHKKPPLPGGGKHAPPPPSPAFLSSPIRTHPLSLRGGPQDRRGNLNRYNKHLCNALTCHARLDRASSIRPEGPKERRVACLRPSSGLSMVFSPRFHRGFEHRVAPPSTLGGGRLPYRRPLAGTLIFP